jgi:hypothetical protein
VAQVRLTVGLRSRILEMLNEHAERRQSAADGLRGPQQTSIASSCLF